MGVWSREYNNRAVEIAEQDWNAQDKLLGEKGKISVYIGEYKIKKERRGWDSNPRGQSPMD